jgi:hypothetical protein
MGRFTRPFWNEFSKRIIAKHDGHDPHDGSSAIDLIVPEA